MRQSFIHKALEYLYGQMFWVAYSWARLVNKPIVVLCIDSSGSMCSFKEPDMTGLDVTVLKVYFDTQIHYRKSSGGGGTDYCIIEKFIRTLPKHPEQIIVFTDAVGDWNFDIKHRQRWAIMLPEEFKGSLVSPGCLGIKII